MTQPKRFLTIAAFCIALVAVGSASATDVVTYNEDTAHLFGTDRTAVMRVSELENVTAYGDDWNQVAPGVMERHSENGYVRHIFGEDGLAWKIQTLTEEAHELRFKAEPEATSRLELMELEVRIEKLKGLQKSIGVRPGGGSRFDPCKPREFELTAEAGPVWKEEGHWSVDVWAHTMNYGSVCEAVGSIYARSKVVASSENERSWQGQGYFFGHGEGMGYGPHIYGDDYPTCYESEAMATYEDNRYFEVSVVDNSVSCW